MKRSLLLPFLLIVIFQLNAQKLDIKLAPKSQPQEIFNQILLSATLTNDTGEPMRIFRNHLTSYGGVIHEWKIYLNGKLSETCCCTYWYS